MKNPLVPNAFDNSLVISSPRVEPPLLRASLLSESIQPSTKPLFNTGNPSLVFNKVFFFSLVITLDSLLSKERLPCLIHFFTDTINRNGALDNRVNALIIGTPVYIFFFPAAQSWKQVLNLWHGRGAGLLFVWIEDPNLWKTLTIPVSPPACSIIKILNIFLLKKAEDLYQKTPLTRME